VQNLVLLNNQVDAGERAGTPDVADSFRAARRDVQDVVADIDRALGTIRHDLRLADGELHAATVERLSEDYNVLHGHQVELRRQIVEAIETILDAIGKKERLARQRLTILNQVCPGTGRNSDAIRHQLSDILVAHLKGNRDRLFPSVDCSSLRMTTQGDLLP
jgi:DNA repair ATPase RecN